MQSKDWSWSCGHRFDQTKLARALRCRQASYVLPHVQLSPNSLLSKQGTHPRAAFAVLTACRTSAGSHRRGQSCSFSASDVAQSSPRFRLQGHQRQRTREGSITPQLAITATDD